MSQDAEILTSGAGVLRLRAAVSLRDVASTPLHVRLIHQDDAKHGSHRNYCKNSCLTKGLQSADQTKPQRTTIQPYRPLQSYYS